MNATEASTEAGVRVPVSPPRENLIRAMPTVGLERSDDADGMPTLTGHFAVFDQWTEINSLWEGHFMERFAAGAFDKTIRENRARMRVLFQHGQDPQIGDKPLGRIHDLEADDYGVRYEVPLLDVGYTRDLIPGLEADLYGASFRFQVMKEEFDKKPKRTKDNPDGLPERTVTEARVMEFGPVTFPAYAGATAGLRSLTDEFVISCLAQDPEKLAALAERAGLTFAKPDPSGATTSPNNEPEPSEATTRSRTDLFWFVDDPAVKGAK